LSLSKFPRDAPKAFPLPRSDFDFSRGFLVFEKIMHHLFPGRSSDHVSLARVSTPEPSASVRESQQQQLILQISVNRRCRDEEVLLHLFFKDH